MPGPTRLLARPAREVIPSVCTQIEPAAPSNLAQALAMLRASLGYLTSCDPAELGTAAQAEALIGLEQAEAQHTAARARMLAVFSAQQGHQADGQYGPAAWLRAFTKITNGAAAGAVRWARRLAAHPLIAEALAAGQLSVSWAKALCGWTDQLPQDRRADADRILLAAAQGGAELADLAALAVQMIERSRTTPDRPAPIEQRRDPHAAVQWFDRQTPPQSTQPAKTGVSRAGDAGILLGHRREQPLKSMCRPPVRAGRPGGAGHLTPRAWGPVRRSPGG